MANYTILTPPGGEGPLCTILTSPDEVGPLCTIITSKGDVVAYQVPIKWTGRIVDGLKLLDLMERSQGRYIELIKKELGINDET